MRAQRRQDQGQQRQPGEQQDPGGLTAAAQARPPGLARRGGKPGPGRLAVLAPLAMDVHNP